MHQFHFDLWYSEFAFHVIRFLNYFAAEIDIKNCFDLGSLNEGIYRRAGPLVTVNLLLEQFKNDAWEFNLSPSEFCGYAVATALKRFFRNLAEPLLPPKCRNDLFLASGYFHFYNSTANELIA